MSADPALALAAALAPAPALAPALAPSCLASAMAALHVAPLLGVAQVCRSGTHPVLDGRWLCEQAGWGSTRANPMLHTCWYTPRVPRLAAHVQALRAAHRGGRGQPDGRQGADRGGRRQPHRAGPLGQHAARRGAPHRRHGGGRLPQGGSGWGALLFEAPCRAAHRAPIACMYAGRGPARAGSCPAGFTEVSYRVGARAGAQVGLGLNPFTSRGTCKRIRCTCVMGPGGGLRGAA